MEAIQMEETLVFSGLASPTYQERAQAVEWLRGIMKKTGGRYHFKSLEKLISLLSERLADSNWSVRNDTLTLVAELVGNSTLPDLQRYITSLFPSLLLNLGDTKVVIRKAALLAIQVLHSLSLYSISYVVPFFVCLFVCLMDVIMIDYV